MSPHSLYNAFKASTPAFGTWITFPGALTARYIAASSPHLSWVMIDCEHGATPLSPGAYEAVHAISGLGPSAPSVLVRIPATGACSSTSWQIKYVLDGGASGVLVPMVRHFYIYPCGRLTRSPSCRSRVRRKQGRLSQIAGFPLSEDVVTETRSHRWLGASIEESTLTRPTSTSWSLFRSRPRLALRT